VFKVQTDEDKAEDNEIKSLEDPEVTELNEDNELNEILARGDDEIGIFTQMDIDRRAARAAAWAATGTSQPRPPALMDESELPAFYRRDLGAEMAAALVNAEEEGRGRRKKTDVQYTDGLTDEQWANAVDASDDDVDDAADRKKLRVARMKERKFINSALEEAEAEGKPLAATSIRLKQVPADEGPETPIGAFGGKGKKRARPSTSATPSIQGDESYAVSL
jgi:ATP-dependent helicase STH1/SNF2